MRSDRAARKSRRRWMGRAAGACAILLGAAYALHSETLTLTTLYPSPAGVYRKLVATLDVILARDGGRVGVGTPQPAAKLHVAGDSRFSGNVHVEGAFTVAGSTAVYRDANGVLTLKKDSVTTTVGCGGVDTYRKCPCYYTCDGLCRFHNSAGDTGCYSCGPMSCTVPNVKIGSLFP